MPVVKVQERAAPGLIGGKRSRASSAKARICQTCQKDAQELVPSAQRAFATRSIAGRLLTLVFTLPNRRGTGPSGSRRVA